MRLHSISFPAKLRSHPKRSLLILIIVVVGAGLTWMAWQFASHTYNHLENQQAVLSSNVRTLNTEKQNLQAQLLDLQRQLDDTKKQQSQTKDDYEKRIKALEDKLSALEKKTANQKTVPKVSSAKPNTSKTIASSPYDRITGNSEEIKAKATQALHIIEQKAPYYYGVFATYVESMPTGVNNTSGCMGGVQYQKTITLYSNSNGCMLTSTDADVTSLLLHEIKHIDSVYVEKNYTSGKLQELPSLYLERQYYDILGVSKFYRDSTEATIAYWESQP
jgi:hypothetical protein